MSRVKTKKKIDAKKKKKKQIQKGRAFQKELQQDPTHLDKIVSLGTAQDPYEMESTQVNPFTGATKRTFSSLRKRNIVRKNPISTTIYALGTPDAQEASKLLDAEQYKKYRAIDDDTPIRRKKSIGGLALKGFKNKTPIY
jgi:hypothetical protein|tara:strand:+ start:86 stop:505 length:420 start_codon:yes stop_codon:yes gene_type:complete